MLRYMLDPDPIAIRRSRMSRFDCCLLARSSYLIPVYQMREGPTSVRRRRRLERERGWGTASEPSQAGVKGEARRCGIGTAIQGPECLEALMQCRALQTGEQQQQEGSQGRWEEVDGREGRASRFGIRMRKGAIFEWRRGRAGISFSSLAICTGQIPSHREGDRQLSARWEERKKKF